VPLRNRTWAVFVLTAALFGGLGRGRAQPLSEPPPLPATLDAVGGNVIATTNVRPPPFTVHLTVPDDGLAAPTKILRVVACRPDFDATPLRPILPAQVSVEAAGPASVALGEPLHYEFIVRNTGDAPAGQVQVEDRLPSGAKPLLTDPPAEVRAGSLTWELGTLEAGAERHLKVDLQNVGSGELQRAPRIAYTAAVALPTRVVRPAFMVALIGPETATPGATVAFQIQLSNDGTVPIRHIVLRDHLPPGLSYPRGYVIEAEVGDLAPGQSRTVRLDATAVQLGRFVNEVVATADGGLRATSRCALEIVAGPKEKPTGASSFATGRNGPSGK
jgi:uncharacterized repeat protein (TIGR01451 family)